MRKTKDIILIGVALFAMFFGAGNLIFPPKLGILSGASWIEAICGFFTSDVALSILGFVAVAKSGGTFTSFTRKVGPKFSIVMGIILMLIMGPLLALPRTGAVSFEMGILPIFPAVSQYLFTLIYFGISLFFVLDSKGLIDKIAVLLTPVLLIALITIIVKNISISSCEMPESTIDNVYTYAFLQGYQTLDGIGAVIFASIILLALKEKGYTDTSAQISMTIKSGLLAFSIIGFVYGGLIFLGASGSAEIAENLSRTETFMALVESIFGKYGVWVVAITVIFACFTTTVGLTSTVAEYFADISKNKLPYKLNVTIITVISFILANLGVKSIVLFSGPILSIIYPAIIVLILLNLAGKYISSKNIYVGAVGGAISYSILLFISNTSDSLINMKEFLTSFPMSTYEMGWILPSLVGAFLLSLTPKFKTGKK